jgi:ABC-2 type transport system permease protein
MTVEALRTAARARNGSTRRIASLGRAEALLLRRNPIALLIALAVPVSLLLMLRSSQPLSSSEGLGAGATIVTTLTAVTLLVVYYNLVTALVARREDLVLKRLRTGQTSDAEILAGTAAPAVAIAWAQIAVGGVAAFVLFGLTAPVNVVLVVVALVLGTAVFVLLAALTTAVTRSVEMAQLTTTPVLVVSLALSGLYIPLGAFPGPLEQLARVLPLTPVVDLLRLGLTGTAPDGHTVDLTGSFGAAASPLLVLTVWVTAGAWATRRWFRWEPRR